MAKPLHFNILCFQVVKEQVEIYLCLYVHTQIFFRYLTFLVKRLKKGKKKRERKVDLSQVLSNLREKVKGCHSFISCHFI